MYFCVRDPQLESGAALRCPVLRLGWIRAGSVRPDLQRMDYKEPGWHVCVFGVHDGYGDVNPLHGKSRFAQLEMVDLLISWEMP